MSEDRGRIFREAWFSGVRRHYTGSLRGFVSPWEDMPEWEQAVAATTVYDQVAALVSSGATHSLTREQKGRFVALCWMVQMHSFFSEPKASYVADWSDLPVWQQETDSDIFERIESKINGPEGRQPDAGTRPPPPPPDYPEPPLEDLGEPPDEPTPPSRDEGRGEEDSYQEDEHSEYGEDSYGDEESDSSGGGDDWDDDPPGYR